MGAAQKNPPRTTGSHSADLQSLDKGTHMFSALFLRHIKRIAAAALAWIVLIPPAAAWQPSQPIEFVVSAGQNGGADKMARIMLAIIRIEELTTQPITITNMANNSGAQALQHMVSNGSPDHTIMMTLNSFFTTPLRQPELGVEILDFQPIAHMGEDTFLLWTHQADQIANMDDFIAAAKERGFRWVMGGTGSGTADNILSDYLNKAFGLNMTYVPMQGGGDVARLLSIRQIASTVNNPAEALGYFENGQVRPVVAFTEDRLDMFPDVPTLKELGQDFHYSMQRDIVGGPNMSEQAQEFYADMFEKVFNSVIWQEYRDSRSLIGDFMTGEELRENWAAVKAKHQFLLKK